MKKVYTITFISLFFLFLGCNNQKSLRAPVSNVLANSSKYIEAISPIGVERLGKIAISFLYEPKCPMGDALSLSPAQKGTWEFEGKTAIFTPNEPYKANSKITLSADCGKLFNESSKSELYKQDFYVSPAKYNVSFDEVRYNDNAKTYIVSGSVTTDIPVSSEDLSKCLRAKYDNKNKTIQWQKSETENVWNFSLNDIPSTDKQSKLSIDWNAKTSGMTRQQIKNEAIRKDIFIPSNDEFTILDINKEKNNTVYVSFSKTLDKSIDPSSFVRAYNYDGKITDEFNTSIHGNVITIYSDNGFADIQTVSLEQGLKSKEGIYLAEAKSFIPSDTWELPEVRFPNDNVILPTTQGTVFPIETRNLKGVLVQVYSIPDRNINQFLQENELNESYKLYRVGEPVWEKKVNFKWNLNMQNKYIPNGLDLSSLVKKYPNGMFHIRVTFRPDQVVYTCKNNHNFENLPQPPETIEPYSVPTEKSSWDYWENVKSNDRSNFWSYRRDPCHPAFYLPGYNSNCLISRNILISDIGLMAKRDNENKLYVTVTDIKTAKPMPNVSVELKNYVGRPLKTLTSDANGVVKFDNGDKAFVVSAVANGQISYLKIAEGTNLSTSHFNIGGEKSKEGVKGFIYGERGVWRPGDTLYLTFVLQDLKNILPTDIPVNFELVDPLGRIADTQVLKDSLNGFYPIQTCTEKDSKTGIWTARVKIGGNVWTKSLSIETVVPNHLSVELEANGEYLEPYDNQLTVKGAWLHGAPTPNYNADVSVAFFNADTTFDGYGDYTFTNLKNRVESYRNTIWRGNLDSDSQVTFKPQLDAGRNLPGKLKASFITRIFEPSGGFSTQSKSMIYSPYSRYVGIKLPKGDAARNMLLTDTPHTVDVVLLQSDGKPVDSANLSYTVYKIEWKWWWEKDAYTSATYVSSSYYNKVASGNLDISNGKGSFDFQVNYPDWGRYLVEVRDGNYAHSASKIVYIDWPGWAGRAQEGGTGSSAMLPLTTLKEEYKVGDIAEISFTSNSEAYAYITLEKAGTVIKQQMIKTVEGTNVYKLPLTPEMAPNIYAHITLLQPHMQTANSLPIRLYGVIPVMVDDPKTLLIPRIKSVKSFKPNESANFTVSEKNGHPMTYTIAIVDEGLLGLTNYHGPKLRDEFYKKEASELENWDIFRYVINAYSGKLETLLAIGGSEEADKDNGNNENRFDPVVKFFGPFYLEAGESKKNTFIMPNYIGAVRAIVIAGDNGAYGIAEKTVPVTSPLMVQPSIPRTIGCNESILIPVSIFNGEDFSKDITMKVKMSGAVKNDLTKKIKIKPNSSETLTFELNTNESGTVTVDFTTTDGTNTVESSIPVKVESRGSPVTYKQSFILKGKKNQTVSVDAGAEKGTDSLKLELSQNPTIDLSQRLDYLIKYPHGCIEQITSGGFPQIFIPSYMKLSYEETAKIKENVESVFNRYSTYQTVSGAMAYWPGEQAPHSWGTCYSAHFMLEAKNKGYAVPKNILDAELEWLADTAKQWSSASSDSKSIQAYRLFVLALAGKPDMSAMNRLASEYSLDSESAFLLSAAYANAKMKDKAYELCKKYSPDSQYYRSMNNYFSSSLRENSIFMYACIKADYQSPISSMVTKLTDTLSSNTWLSTQETVWMLLALLPHYADKTYTPLDYEVECNGSSIVDKLDIASKIITLNPVAGAKSQSAIVKNNSKNILYGSLVYSGNSIPGSEKSINEKINLSVTGLYKDTYEPGETVNFKVTVKNYSDKNLSNLALTVPIPTCFEFTNERLANQSYNNSSFTYQDIRDDYIYTYFDLNRNNSVTFEFSATVGYTGNFYIPAIHVEAMYDNDIRALVPGKYVQMK